MDLLRQVPFFKAFTDREREEVYTYGSEKIVSPQAHLIIEGEHSRGVYVLLEGQVSVYKNDRKKGHMVRLTYLESGAVFGELSLIDTAPPARPPWWQKMSVRCFFLDTEAFERFLADKGTEVQSRFYKPCAHRDHMPSSNSAAHLDQKTHP